LRARSGAAIPCTVLVIDATANKDISQTSLWKASKKLVFNLTTILYRLIENELFGKFPNLEPQEKKLKFLQ
jgi:hypothetical protein